MPVRRLVRHSLGDGRSFSEGGAPPAVVFCLSAKAFQRRRIGRAFSHPPWESRPRGDSLPFGGAGFYPASWQAISLPHLSGPLASLRVLRVLCASAVNLSFPSRPNTARARTFRRSVGRGFLTPPLVPPFCRAGVPTPAGLLVAQDFILRIGRLQACPTYRARLPLCASSAYSAPLR